MVHSISQSANESDEVELQVCIRKMLGAWKSGNSVVIIGYIFTSSSNVMQGEIGHFEKFNEMLWWSYTLCMLSNVIAKSGQGTRYTIFLKIWMSDHYQNLLKSKKVKLLSEFIDFNFSFQ